MSTPYSPPRLRPEKTLVFRRKFSGHLIKLDVATVELAPGRRARREIVRHPGAVAVLGRRPDRRFVFVRQFRKAIEKRLLEIVAGTRAPGESAAACARREVREETGYAVAALKPLGSIYTAPGFCDERIDIFFADLKSSGHPPCPDPDEQLETVCLGAGQIRQMLATGKIKDAKTIAAWAMYCGGSLNNKRSNSN